MNTFTTCMARYMHAGLLEIGQFYHLHGQDSEPRRDVEHCVRVWGPYSQDFAQDLKNILLSSTTQKAEQTRAPSSFLSLFVHHARSRATQHPIAVHCCGSQTRENNAAAGGPSGKKVRPTLTQPDPAACTRSDASSRSPPPCRSA